MHEMKNGFEGFILKLEEDNKLKCAYYWKRFYWSLKSYLNFVQLAANGYLKDVEHLSLSKITRFFKKFKNGFKASQALPKIGYICKGISLVTSFLSNKEG